VTALQRLRSLLAISDSDQIVRRYFVVNGFDGALAMLGLMVGFHVSRPVDHSVVITSGLATTFALGMSGISSAYMSEVAERRRALARLEEAMVSSLAESEHARAATWIPWLVAAVNGLAPLVIGLLVVLPIWLEHIGVTLPIDPLPAAIFMALMLIFLLGVFLGRVDGTFWLWSGLRSLALALLTIGVIFLVS
jgi:predicted membrane protein (TIGR00267 family)